jgi:hypothetical protein
MTKTETTNSRPAHRFPAVKKSTACLMPSCEGRVLLSSALRAI